MSDIIKRMEEMIEADKEMVGLLPLNNLKNITKSLETMTEVKNKYQEFYDEIIGEVESRYDKINAVQENPEINNIEQEIKKIEQNVILNNMKTSYEKMELDRLIYSINGYYKKKLNVVNQEIYNCLKKFEEVGIILTEKDFDYSEYANEYMKTFIEEAKKGNINSDKMKEKFEKIYIKCSEIIMHISLNLRYLYHKNEKNIDKYYENKKEQILKEMGLTEEQLIETYEAMKGRVIRLKEKDDRIILDKFMNVELMINDYTDDNIKEMVNRMSTSAPKDFEEFYSNVRKLTNNLYEYKIYTEYKFLIDDIIAAFKKNERSKNDKDKAKNKKSKYEERIEEITKEEKKLLQLNANINKKSSKLAFGKKKASLGQEILERNNQILKLKDLYRKLDDDMINKGISEKVAETSSILDILVFASSYYNFIARGIIKQFPEIIEDEINAMIEKLKDFVKLPYFSVINNINITETKDLTIIIKDKYKLLGLNVNKEDFEESSIDGLANVTRALTMKDNIQHSNLSVEDIGFMCKAKEILKR